MSYKTGDRKQMTFLPPTIEEYVGAAFSSPRKRAYKAAGKDCRGCPHFGVCTTSRDGRRVVRMAEESLKESRFVLQAKQNII